MKQIWQGSISFGLVSIPVKLYPAIQGHALGFTLLHDRCKTPLQYERWCPTCNEKVAWQDVVKGIKLNGQENYTVITSNELAALKPEKTDSIDIVACIKTSALDPLYFNNHYYVEPAKKNNKGFFLLREALAAQEYLAIGQFVMHEKEHLGAIQAYKKGLLLSTLHYAYEIRPIKDVAITKSPTLSKQERLLAQELVQKLYTPKFTLAHFKDSYMHKLKLALKKKEKEEKNTKHLKRRKKKAIPKSETLISTLRKSLKKSPLEKQRPAAHAQARRH